MREQLDEVKRKSDTGTEKGLPKIVPRKPGFSSELYPHPVHSLLGINKEEAIQNSLIWLSSVCQQEMMNYRGIWRRRPYG